MNELMLMGTIGVIIVSILILFAMAMEQIKVSMDRKMEKRLREYEKKMGWLVRRR